MWSTAGKLQTGDQPLEMLGRFIYFSTKPLQLEGQPSLFLSAKHTHTSPTAHPRAPLSRPHPTPGSPASSFSLPLRWDASLTPSGAGVEFQSRVKVEINAFGIVELALWIIRLPAVNPIRKVALGDPVLEERGRGKCEGETGNGADERRNDGTCQLKNRTEWRNTEVTD